MILDERILRLIAVGASISVNWKPCSNINVAKARENGASEQEIAEAIWVGTLVRREAAIKMDRFAKRLCKTNPGSLSEPCGSCEWV
jgi:AhpD family alkylhydroperoxidase